MITMMLGVLAAIPTWSSPRIVVPLIEAPIAITRAAYGENYLTARDSNYSDGLNMDCVSMQNVSLKTIGMTRVSFNIANAADGSTEKRTISFNHTQDVPPGGVLTIENNCYAGGYTRQSTRDAFVAWIAHVTFTDGTSWDSPAGDDLSRDIASAVVFGGRSAV